RPADVAEWWRGDVDGVYRHQCIDQLFGDAWSLAGQRRWSRRRDGVAAHVLGQYERNPQHRGVLNGGEDTRDGQPYGVQRTYQASLAKDVVGGRWIRWTGRSSKDAPRGPASEQVGDVRMPIAERRRGDDARAQPETVQK